MTRESVWMPIYIGDYLGATQRLTTEQHGAYLLLLMDYWRNGPPPIDDEVLSSITRLKSARFRKHKSTLLGFFVAEAGTLRHRRVDAEIAKAKQNADRRTEKASKAARARWEGASSDAPSNASGNATSNAPECPPPSPSFSYEKGSEAADPAKLIFCEGLALLTGSGRKESAARSLLGRLRKQVGDERLAALIGQASRENYSDPAAWLSAAANSPANDQAALLDSIALRFGAGRETA